MKPEALNSNKAQAVAEETLLLFPSLVTEANYAKMGFEAPLKDMDGLSLGQSLPVFYIFDDVLNNFTVEETINDLLSVVKERIYLVFFKGTVVSSIVVAVDDVGKWAVRNLGNTNLATAVYHTLQKQIATQGPPITTYMLVDIPAKHLKFLAHYVDNNLMFCHIFDNEEFGFHQYESQKAEAVFKKITAQ